MDTVQQLQFIELYTKSQKNIHLYILSMVHCPSDAEDIMQQTAAAMWQMFDRFQEGSNFIAWGISIARFRILDYRKHKQKHRLFLSEDVYQHIIDTMDMERICRTSDDRASALKGCLKQLNESDSRMLQMHYGGGVSYKKIAKELGKSTTGIYKVMTRIHNTLHSCIKKTLMLWEAGAYE